MAERKRITARELIVEIIQHPDWLDLPVHVLVMDDGDDGGFLNTVETDRFEVDGPDVLSLISEKPEPEKVPCPEGYHWIGQSLRYCDHCSFAPWEHAGVAVLDEDAGPFSGKFVLRPFKPGEAERLREKFGGAT